jgi:hypothetical protein
MAEINRSRILLLGVLFALGMTPVLLWLNYIDRQELMYPVIASAAAIILVIRGRWDLRNRPWFWFTMLVIIALHVVIVWRIPWKSGWVPAPVTSLFCIIDLVVIFSVLAGIQKVADWRRANNESRTSIDSQSVPGE